MNNDTGGKTPIQERLEQLAVQFLQRTAREVLSLRDFLAQTRSGDTDALEQMRHLAHRIYGTGATLGFASISECAAELERLADAQTATGTVCNPQALERLTQSATRLEREVERIVKTRGLE